MGMGYGNPVICCQAPTRYGLLLSAGIGIKAHLELNQDWNVKE